VARVALPWEIYGLRNDAETTKARDFILALLPQYPFYHVPNNAKALTFFELFLDLVRQTRNAGHKAAPLFIAETGVSLADIINGTAEGESGGLERLYTTGKFA
jgi:hypothetical protein